MKLTEQTRRTALAALQAELARGAFPRRHLLDAAVRAASPAPAKNENQIRSYAGSLLDALVAEGQIALSGGLYRASESPGVTVRASDCRARILSLLTRRRMSEAELCAAIGAALGVDRTATKRDDLALSETVSAQLADLFGNGLIGASGEKYYKLTPAPITSESAFREVLFSRLHEMGGGFFERFVAGALEAYFLHTGRSVTYCDVTGGSSDGGIDVIVDTVDGLGFTEHILVQTKNRKNLHTTEKEIREFYGAMHAGDGSRGIFVTAAAFHPSAAALLDSLPNCVGIDGDKLFQILLMTGYGIVRTREGFLCDESVFSLV